MNTATPLPWPELSAGENARSTFRADFEHAPVAAARCTSRGVIVEMNAAFSRTVGPASSNRGIVDLCELVRPRDRNKIESLLRDLFASRCDHFGFEAEVVDLEQANARWTVWRQSGGVGQPDHALLMAEHRNGAASLQESLVETQRWEAIGRLTGGVVHDFNNLLTGVMLYCDLLLSSLDPRDRRRRYADEIRSATVQATGLVRQLLVFARPPAVPTRLIGLNEVAEGMQDLLTRLIGENIELDLQLDPELGVVNIDQTQVQQILLNLVLNARDALRNGGRITIETSNCRFQPIASAAAGSTLPAFPCVLLVVSDNGHGMDVRTRQRLFEPFFTTKSDGQGTGLGLTTVRSIVTTNRGLIHFETEPGRGTRVMILLPPSISIRQSKRS